MLSQRLLVLIFSLATCFMTTGCFSCSLSTSAAPSQTKTAEVQSHMLTASNEVPPQTQQR